MVAPQVVPATPGEWLTQPLYRRRKAPPRKTPPPTTQNPVPAKREPRIRVPAWIEYWNAVETGNAAVQKSSLDYLFAAARKIANKSGWNLAHDNSPDCWNGCVYTALDQWKLAPKTSFWTILTRRMIDAIRESASNAGLVYGCPVPQYKSVEQILDAQDRTGQSRPDVAANRLELGHKGLRAGRAEMARRAVVKKAFKDSQQGEFLAFLCSFDHVAFDIFHLRWEGYKWSEVAEELGLASGDAARIRSDRASKAFDNALQAGQLDPKLWLQPTGDGLKIELSRIAAAVLKARKAYFERQSEMAEYRKWFLGKPFIAVPAAPRPSKRREKSK